MLSDEALDLFRRHPGGRIIVDDANRDACRELAREGVLVVGHSFAAGREAFYVPTAMGRELAEVMGAHQRAIARRIRLAPSVIGSSVFGPALNRGDVINMAALLPFVGDDRVDAVAESAPSARCDRPSRPSRGQG